jgi:hypothetical protein
MPEYTGRPADCLGLGNECKTFTVGVTTFFEAVVAIFVSLSGSGRVLKVIIFSNLINPYMVVHLPNMVIFLITYILSPPQETTCGLNGNNRSVVSTQPSLTRAFFVLPSRFLPVLTRSVNLKFAFGCLQTLVYHEPGLLQQS